MKHAFRLTTATAASIWVLALSGCNKVGDPNQSSGATAANSALPTLPQAVAMQSGPATSITPAPSVAQLHALRPVAVARPADPSAAYAYLDRANGVSEAVGDAPPDYSYDDDGVRPWAWQTHQGDTQYAEPVDGGYRYYYYQPGESEPYLVRDRDYSYAYAGGALVAIYAASGALLPPDDYSRRRDYASRYYWRARELRRSAAQQHQGIIGADWAAHRAEINAAHASWDASRAQQPQWQNYHDQHASQEQAHWQGERQRRQAEAERFTSWQSQGFQGEPPQVSPDNAPAAGRRHDAMKTPEPFHQEAASANEHNQQAQPTSHTHTAQIPREHPMAAPQRNVQPHDQQRAKIVQNLSPPQGPSSVRPMVVPHQLPVEHKPDAVKSQGAILHDHQTQPIQLNQTKFSTAQTHPAIQRNKALDFQRARIAAPGGQTVAPPLHPEMQIHSHLEMQPRPGPLQAVGPHLHTEPPTRPTRMLPQQSHAIEPALSHMNATHVATTPQPQHLESHAPPHVEMHVAPATAQAIVHPAQAAGGPKPTRPPTPAITHAVHVPPQLKKNPDDRHIHG